MSMFKHQNTGAVAELLEKKENTVRLKVTETKEVKEIGLATFKRWWKAHTEEAASEAPVEPVDVPCETETPEPVETPAEKPEAPKDDEKPLALSEIVNKLENLFDMLNSAHFEGKLPRPILTIQSSPKFFGSTSTKKIWKKDADGENQGQYEINIGAEFLNRPSEYTAATLMHEMVHLYCRENAIEETCQGGRYHNKRFAQECEKRGLKMEYNRTQGYAISLPTESFVENLRTNGFTLEVPFARHTIEKERKHGERAKTHLYYCPVCDQQVRTTQDLKLKCGICDIDMECERADD